jgi:hypothetical protein
MTKSYYNTPKMETKIVSRATVINRNFYQSLRKQGRTHTDVMNSIQPERYNQFLEDILPVVPECSYGKKKISLWGKLVKYFKGK